MDGLAIDAYNWHICRPNENNVWKTLATIIEPFRQFGLAHPGKEMWLTEWATWEDPAVTNRKAQWIDQARALFAQPAYSQFEGVLYFHSRAINASFVNCDWRVTTSASSLAAFRAMALDPLYNGQAIPPTTTSTSSTSSTSTTSTTSTTTTSTTTPGETTTTLAPTSITHVGQASANANATTHSVVIPAGVQAGDALILAFSSNTNANVTGPSGVTGWASLGVRSNTSMSSRLWSRVAVAGDAGQTITVTVAQQSKASLTVVAYRGTSATNPRRHHRSLLE